ncbi:MAG: hypothetical protein HYV07_30350 [Deltaproteobacteria bacterium]|nr:hypothetical protein [Deltaproteobacteria bacterium]
MRVSKRASNRSLDPSDRSHDRILLAWPLKAPPEGLSRRGRRMRATPSFSCEVDVAGRITTVVGDGASGFAGDGGRGAAGSLASPADLVVDPTGTLFIADAGNHRVRRLPLVPGDHHAAELRE